MHVLMLSITLKCTKKQAEVTTQTVTSALFIAA